MMNLETDLKSKTMVKVLSRLRVLYYVIYELANAFGVDEDTLESIKKGVLERQIIKIIFIDYYTDSAIKPSVRIKITIDWDKHNVFAATEDGESFKLNTDKSIHSQISEASDYIIKHVEQLREAYSICKIETYFRYADPIRLDEKKHQEAREFLGHKPYASPELQEDEEFAKKITQEFKLLPELQLDVMSKN